MLDTIFLVTASLGGTIMVCQFLLSVLGLGETDTEVGGVDGADFEVSAEVEGGHHTSLGHAAEADVDHPDSSFLFQLISFRTVVAALTFFGLGGAWSSASGYSPALSLLIGIIAGYAAMYGVYRLMKAIYGFQSSGNVDIRNAVGQAATIYIPVPASGSGKGKVQITLQGRTMEYEALTDEDNDLATGENVVVEHVLSSDLVRVSRANAET